MPFLSIFFIPKWAVTIPEVYHMSNQMIRNVFGHFDSKFVKIWYEMQIFYQKCYIYGYSFNNGGWGDFTASAWKTESDRILNFVVSNQEYMCHYLCKVSASWRTPIFYKYILIEFCKSKWKPKMPFLSDFLT